MSDAKFTPGPWKVVKRDCGDDIFSGNKRIANTYGDEGEECEANARLIAAAPTLMKACEDVCGVLEDLENYGSLRGCGGSLRGAIIGSINVLASAILQAYKGSNP